MFSNKRAERQNAMTHDCICLSKAIQGFDQLLTKYNCACMTRICPKWVYVKPYPMLTGKKSVNAGICIYIVPLKGFLFLFFKRNTGN